MHATGDSHLEFRTFLVLVELIVTTLFCTVQRGLHYEHKQRPVTQHSTLTKEQTSAKTMSICGASDGVGEKYEARASKSTTKTMKFEKALLF